MYIPNLSFANGGTWRKLDKEKINTVSNFQCKVDRKGKTLALAFYFFFVMF